MGVRMNQNNSNQTCFEYQMHQYTFIAMIVLPKPLANKYLEGNYNR